MKRVGTFIATACLAGSVLTAVSTTAIGTAASATATTGAESTACSLAPTGGPVTKILWKGLDFGPYRLTVPPGMSGDVPLLIDLHGGGGTAGLYEFLTGWPDYAMRKKDFILAAPNSEIPGAWMVQGGPSLDANFIKTLVEELATTYCIDRKRIYISGHSLGGVMTDKMICENAGLFAAAAPYAGSPSSTFGVQCNPTRPVPIAFFHGDLDTNAPLFLQEQNRDAWVDRENCNATPTRVTDSRGYTDTYSGCDGGSEIKWRLLKNQIHAWPFGDGAEDMRDRMWAFFDAHPLP